MLRVTIHDSAGELLLRLEGRLAGPWVREVELCWQTAQSIIRGRRVTVDLCAVDFVDSAGEQLLAAMHERGARLFATGPMTGNLVSRIARAAVEKEPSPRREARPY